MKVFKNIYFACILIVFFCTSSNLLAATYYVSTSGNDTSGTGNVASPWGTVYYAVSQLQAGDTLLIREGLYREQSSIDNFNSGTATNPILIKSYPGEKVIISAMTDASSSSDWEKVSGNIYRYIGTSLSSTVYNMSQSGIPLKLAVPYDELNGSISDITIEGQWCRNTTNGDLWVWAIGGGNPSKYNIEYSLLWQLFLIEEDINNIIFEDLILEGGYYSMFVEGDYCEFKNCTFRNCYGEAFKVGDSINRLPAWNSEYGKVINCDIYYFGGCGVDITGGDYWTVRNTSIHDGVENRILGRNLTGILIKNSSVGCVVEDCRIYNIHTVYGAISIGGDSYYDNVYPAQNLIIRNNIIHDIVDTFKIISFMGANNCEFTNNIVYNCNSVYGSIVGLLNGISHNDVEFPCVDNLVANNIFYNNSAYYNYKEYDAGNESGLSINNNIIPDRNSYFDDAVITHANMVSTKGYDVDSFTSTPAFVNYSYELMRLASGSVGIDDGLMLENVVSDYNGMDRFFGGSYYDIGPFENRYDSFAAISDGTSAAGWIPQYGSVSVVFDSGLNSNVLSFNGTGTSYIHVDKLTQPNITFKAKSSSYHSIGVRVKTNAGVFKTIKYYSDYTTKNFSNPDWLCFPLGTGSSSTHDGKWHIYTFDLQAALQEALPSDELDYVDYFYVSTCAATTNIADVELHDTFQSAKTPGGCISDGTNTTIHEWITQYGTVSVVSDSGLNSNVLSFNSAGTSYISVDKLTQANITFKAKASDFHAIAVRVKTQAGVFKIIKYYSNETTTDFSNPNWLKFPLGTGSPSTEDGEWHIYAFDLQAALQEALPSDELDYVEYFYTETWAASPLYIDDVELHDTFKSAKTPGGCISDGTNTTIHEWITQYGTVSVVSDSELNSNVLSFNSAGTSYISVDELTQANITFKAKASDFHAVGVRVKTKAGVFKIIKYYSDYTTKNFSNPDWLRFPLGTGSSSTEDGEWHIYAFDLQAALQEALPSDELDYVMCCYVETWATSPLYIDDVELYDKFMPEGCINEWNFNEAYGAKLEDSGASSYNRTATLTNMSFDDPQTSVWVMGRKNKALRFGDSSSTYVTAPALTIPFAKGLTFSAWVKYENLTDTKAIAAALTGDSVYPRMYQNGSGISFQVQMDGGNLVQAYSSFGKISVGEWIHVAAVVDLENKKIKVYINGNEEGSQSFTYSSIDTGTYPLYIGNDTSGQAFKGCIDEVKLYNRALKAEEIVILAE